MIITRLIGGLGNQMFQYAVGRSLAARRDTQLVLDTSGYDNQAPGDTPRQYELGCFAQSAQLAGADELRQIRIATNPSMIDKLLMRKSSLTAVRENGFAFAPATLEVADNSYLVGYWQSEKYFHDIRDTLLADFDYREQPDEANTKMAAEIAASNAVSVHVRRGDYVTNPNAAQHHGTATLEYYRGAIAAMAGRVKDPHFFVFSDEPAWCQENLKFDYPTTFVSHNTGDKGHEDMRLMSQCRHHIIANSSFSWWGAWLNPRTDKIVMAPEHWFNDPATDTRDLYAAGWEKIAS